jgi:hypothetical protein
MDNMEIKLLLTCLWCLAFNGGNYYGVNAVNVNVFINMPIKSILIKSIWEKR